MLITNFIIGDYFSEGILFNTLNDAQGLNIFYIICCQRSEGQGN